LQPIVPTETIVFVPWNGPDSVDMPNLNFEDIPLQSNSSAAATDISSSERKPSSWADPEPILSELPLIGTHGDQFSFTDVEISPGQWRSEMHCRAPIDPDSKKSACKNEMLSAMALHQLIRCKYHHAEFTLDQRNDSYSSNTTEFKCDSKRPRIDDASLSESRHSQSFEYPLQQCRKQIQGSEDGGDFQSPAVCAEFISRMPKEFKDIADSPIDPLPFNDIVENLRNFDRSEDRYQDSSEMIGILSKLRIPLADGLVTDPSELEAARESLLRTREKNTLLRDNPTILVVTNILLANIAIQSKDIEFAKKLMFENLTIESSYQYADSSLFKIKDSFAIAQHFATKGYFDIAKNYIDRSYEVVAKKPMTRETNGSNRSTTSPSRSFQTFSINFSVPHKILKTSRG
jgi:hypothetical protein